MSTAKDIWNKFAELEKKLNSVQAELNNFKQASPEVLSEAKEHSKKTSEFRNKAKIAMEEAQQSSLEAGKRDINITEMAEVIRQVHDESHALLQHNKTASDDSTKFAGIAKERSEYASSMCDNVSELEDNYADTIARMNGLNLEEAETAAKRIKDSLSSAQDNKKELDTVMEEVFGYEAEDDTHVDGVRDRLESTYEKLEKDFKTYRDDVSKSEEEHNERFKKFIDSREGTYKAALKQIETLYSPAMNAGLAGAYEEKITVEVLKIKSHTIAFRAAIGGLIATALLPIIFYIYRVSTGLSVQEVLGDAGYILLATIPLYLPITWLAYSANKSYKLSNRLIEEYTHKGVVSKTYEGLVNQIENLDDNSLKNDLKTRLLFNMVSISGENPGKLISDYNKADHPLMDALDKSTQLADAVSKLSKLPGFGAMAKKMSAQAELIKEKEDKKANAAINATIPDEA